MVSFASSDPASSVQQVVMVADDDVTMLVDNGPCAVPTTELNKVCKRSPEPFIGPFDGADCLHDTAAGHEYAEDEMHQESLCLLGDVAESYEDGTMIRMDRVSVVCDGQTEEHECCDVKELSASHDQVLHHNG